VELSALIYDPRRRGRNRTAGPPQKGLKGSFFMADENRLKGEFQSKKGLKSRGAFLIMVSLQGHFGHRPVHPDAMIRIEYSLQRYSLGLLLILLFMAVPTAWGQTTHIVKKGESLSFIAQKYQVPISKIKEANGLENTRLQIGQSLTIPEPAAMTLEATSSPRRTHRSAAPGQEIPDTYLVKSGDTLSGIAKRTHLTVKELQEINELKGTRLRIGQVLELKQEEELSEEKSIPTAEGGYKSALAANDGAAIPISQGEEVIEERDLNPLVTVAESFLGVKYRRGGMDVKTGLDCSAYVQKVFRMVGMDLPRTAREQFAVGLEVARDALRLGDLVFFKRAKAKRPAHVGIYIGNDQFIHSSNTKRRIRVDSLNAPYFSARFIGGRRIQEVTLQPDAPGPEMEDSRVSHLSFEPAPSVLFLSTPSPPIPSPYPD
jgi:peptidoglycan endopeptidase LytE